MPFDILELIKSRQEAEAVIRSKFLCCKISKQVSLLLTLKSHDIVLQRVKQCTEGVCHPAFLPVDVFVDTAASYMCYDDTLAALRGDVEKLVGLKGVIRQYYQQNVSLSTELYAAECVQLAQQKSSIAAYHTSVLLELDKLIDKATKLCSFSDVEDAQALSTTESTDAAVIADTATESPMDNDHNAQSPPRLCNTDKKCPPVSTCDPNTNDALSPPASGSSTAPSSQEIDFPRTNEKLCKLAPHYAPAQPTSYSVLLEENKESDSSQSCSSTDSKLKRLRTV